MPGTLKARVEGAWVPVLGGTGNEVTVSPDTPTDPDTELWYDTDDVMPFWLPGGSVGQVPMKLSSADGDIQWSDTPYNALPKGLIAWKQGAGSVAITTTATNIYVITANLVAGRAYQVEFDVRAMTAGANLGYYFSGTISPAATQFMIDVHTNANSGAGYASVFCPILLIPATTAAHTITVKCNTSAGTGTIYTAAGSTIRVFDLGLAPVASP